jgi:hypothetical protein
MSTHSALKYPTNSHDYACCAARFFASPRDRFRLGLSIDLTPGRSSVAGAGESATRFAILDGHTIMPSPKRTAHADRRRLARSPLHFICRARSFTGWIVDASSNVTGSWSHAEHHPYIVVAATSHAEGCCQPKPIAAPPPKLCILQEPRCAIRVRSDAALPA